MNILEALNTGKRFRRPHWDIWYSIDMEKELTLSVEDLLVEDWEVEEPINFINFSLAWNRTMSIIDKLDINKEKVPDGWMRETIRAQLIKELGL